MNAVTNFPIVSLFQWILEFLDGRFLIFVLFIIFFVISLLIKNCIGYEWNIWNFCLGLLTSKIFNFHFIQRISWMFHDKFLFFFLFKNLTIFQLLSWTNFANSSLYFRVKQLRPPYIQILKHLENRENVNNKKKFWEYWFLIVKIFPKYS